MEWDAAGWCRVGAGVGVGVGLGLAAPGYDHTITGHRMTGVEIAEQQQRCVGEFSIGSSSTNGILQPVPFIMSLWWTVE